MAEHIGQMLVQRAAQCDVDHLGTTTDPQDGHATAYCAGEQRELERVAQLVVPDGLIGRGVTLLTVGGRVDIPSAGDHQTVESVQHPLGDAGVDGLRRQQRGDAARQGDAFEVDRGQKAGADVPHPGLRPLKIGRQAENGAHLLLARTRAAQSRAPSPNRSRRR